MSDEDNGNAFVTKLFGDTVQLETFISCQRSGRLIHDQNTGITGKSFGDLYQLLSSYGKCSHGLGYIDFFAQRLDQFFGAGSHGFPVIDTKFILDLLTHEDILCNSQIRERGNVLVNSCNTHLSGIGCVTECHSLTFQQHGTAVRLMNTCDNFNKGGFTGSVFTHQSMDLTFFQLKLHTV